MSQCIELMCLEILKLMKHKNGNGPFSYDTETEIDNKFTKIGKLLTVTKWDDDKVK